MKKIVILSLLGMVVLIGIGWLWRYYTAPIEGRVGAREQIQSPANIITSYNHFFDLYAAIKSYDVTLAALQEQLAQVPPGTEHDRILATITGVKSQKGRAIEQYNADARKSYTVGQFKDWSLPYQIQDR